MSALSPSAERALCAYLAQELLNEQADHYHSLRAVQHLSSTHISPGANPYIPLDFSVPEVPTLPDWYDSMDDFDIPDYL